MQTVDSGKPPETPSVFKIVRKVLLAILAFAAIAVVTSIVLLIVGKASGFARGAVAVVMALAIAWFGIGYFNQLGHPPPPDLEPLSVDPRLRLAYVCNMCGLELAVLMVAKERAPKHCGEEMVLIRKDLPI